MITNEDFKTIGQRIKAKREALGWTQRVFSAKSGYCETFISKVENDHHKPSIRAIRILEQTLGCKLTK